MEKDFIINYSDASTSNYATASYIENSKKSGGRPRSSFIEGGSKTKKRRSEELAANHSKDELVQALNIAENKTNQNVNKFVAMYLDVGLSKAKYEKLRHHNKDIFGSQVYPHYKKITEAKESCYPLHVTGNNYGSKVDIISLLDHTLQKILATLDEEELRNSIGKKIDFLVKWGMDGASGQQTTRQAWHAPFVNDTDSDLSNSDASNSENEVTYTNDSDASVFITTLVPLQLKDENKVLWTNDKPSSVLNCRPVNFKFTKETEAVVKQNYNYYFKILSKVKTYILTFKDMTFDVSFDLRCTMIDGKVCYILTGQKASRCCDICMVGPKFINDILKVQNLPYNDKNYMFGFPILHSWIRFMEYVLHLSYNLGFKKGCANGENKIIQKEKKQQVQQSLKKRLNLTVDVVKQGVGTTNTGNVARAFFSEAKIVSNITGINEKIIERLYTVLQIISQRADVNIHKFKDYCIETAHLCTSLYPWYPMPPSVHKVLIHGCDIMQEFPVPIGWFSEEAQEATNKVFRKARNQHSRMYQRTKTNIDTMHYMLIASDPMVSTLRHTKERQLKELTGDAQKFLK